MSIELLIGKTIKSIEGIENDYIYIETDCGQCYNIYHSQDCCESVEIYDTIGNVADVIGSEVIGADESNDEPTDVNYKPYDSYTWTIYTIKTNRGEFKIRWLGQSNGYYGESPYFVRSHAKI